MIQRRQLLKYGLLAGTTTAIAACQNRTNSSSSDKPISLKPIKIAILTWVGYGPFFVAKDQKLFEKYGLDAEILKIEDAAPRRSALASQEVQFSISTLDWFAIEAAQGLPASCILKLDDSYGADGIVSSKEIAKVADLRGQSIAVEKGSPSHFFLLSLMKEAKLSAQDVQSIYMPTAGDAASAFSAGRAKAAVTWEPYLSTSAKQAPNAHILTTSREKPGLLLDLLIVHQEYAKTNPDAVSGVIKAWFDAVEYWKANPTQANAVIAKGLGVSEQEVSEMIKGCKYADLQENATYFGLKGNGTAPFFESFPKAQQVWIEAGLMTKTVKADSVVNTSFLKGIQA
ncbi:ABC transporter substrate-binding protein [Leptolyngbya boryana CZ1]|uniref:ABC transporter substrate-binding protein n=1 Tax=Leptolyngbya boryana CZ1 TaxID=3060204 RepID=A0AA96WTA1_LEPBY|nr:ABC transporter substrate-binding protein [Leptolyngbya boryana]WNZ44883.1 ABC transporter substrate-binding protein [Leptolyngbya boryana CZ1]